MTIERLLRFCVLLEFSMPAGVWSTRVHRCVFLRNFGQTPLNRKKEFLILGFARAMHTRNTHTQSDGRSKKQM